MFFRKLTLFFFLFCRSIVEDTLEQQQNAAKLKNNSQVYFWTGRLVISGHRTAQIARTAYGVASTCRIAGQWPVAVAEGKSQFRCNVNDDRSHFAA